MTNDLKSIQCIIDYRSVFRAWGYYSRDWIRELRGEIP